MGDLIMVAFMLVAFALAWVLVKLCDRIIGTTELAVVDAGLSDDEESEAAAA